MKSKVRAAIVTLIAGLLLPAQVHAGFQAPHFVSVGFDLVLLRPLGLVGAAAGALLFLPAALVSAPNGKQGFDEVKERFISEPVQNTFRRPLGDF